ncbi:MAG: Ig-like domain-containing protein [Gemmatimonadota bacterium]
MWIERTDEWRGRARASALLMLMLLISGCEDAGPTGVDLDPDPDPVPASMELSLEDVTVESLGDTVVVTAQVVDEDGNPISGLSLEWTSSDPDVLQPLGDGRFLTVSDGEARIIVTYSDGDGRELEAEVQVTVDQRAVGLRLSTDPSSEQPLAAIVFRSLGQRLPLSIVPVDAVGTPIAEPEFEVEWAVGNPNVAALDEGEQLHLEAGSHGTTELVLGYGPLSVTVPVEVDAELTLEACASVGSDSRCSEVDLTFTES